MQVLNRRLGQRYFRIKTTFKKLNLIGANFATIFFLETRNKICKYTGWAVKKVVSL